LAGPSPASAAAVVPGQGHPGRRRTGRNTPRRRAPAGSPRHVLGHDVRPVASDKPRPPEPRWHPRPAPALPDLRAVDRHAQQTPSPDAHLSYGRMARPEPATVPSPSCPYAPREARRSSRGS